MPQRFELVSEPVEARIMRGFDEQIEAISAIVFSVSNKTNCFMGSASHALSNKEFVVTMTTTSISLLSPKSLPGFLFSVAILIRLMREIVISRHAYTAVEKQYKNKNE